MKAKPTVYRGIRFRSRLEARWARFFDAIGHEWIYEPVVDGVDIGYLPDFALMSEGSVAYWVETKPLINEPLHDVRWQQFVDATKIPLVLIAGLPGLWEAGQLVDRGYYAALIRASQYVNSRAVFAQCAGCGAIDLEADGYRFCCSSDGPAIDAAFGAVRDMELVDA